MAICDKLFKDAIDGAVNEFKGIEYSYKLDDVLESLGPKQKFNPEQLKGYLLKQGVSPHEIKASQMFKGFEGDNRALSAVEWQGLSGRQHLSKEAKAGYEDITLDKEGANEWSNYKVNEWQAAKPELSTNPSHKFIGPEIAADKSQLGWNRVHEDTINGKPTTVLNELQSDWMQAERQGAGVFESRGRINNDNLKAKINLLEQEESDLFKKSRAKWLEQNNLTLNQAHDLQDNGKIDFIDEVYKYQEKNFADDSKRAVDILKELETLYKDLQAGKPIADFPMKSEKFQQLMIVDALNEAWENGTKRVAIPIERQNELYGSEGVTKFYEQLNKKILPDIRKKLEKQGLRVKVSMENYGSSELKPNKDGGSLGLTKDRPIANRLHILEIEEIPSKRVKWDVYGLLGALGLSEFVDKGDDDGNRPGI